jgi:hypothetical protein
MARKSPRLNLNVATLVVLLGLTLFWVTIATVDLANYPPVTADESWIMSVSENLVSRGQFGSLMFAGLYHADQHYFLNLPFQHIEQAMVFQLWGTGVAQARWVSIASGIGLLWIVSALGWRWRGPLGGLLCAIVLVFWRSDMAGAARGIVLLDMARSARYDLNAVFWMWLAAALVEWEGLLSSVWLAWGAGLCAGLATLTQFFGVFSWPWLMTVRWLEGGRSAWRAVGLMLLSGGLVVLPYLLWAGRYLPDVVGQMSTNGGRAEFGNPVFYLVNLSHEPLRYERMVTPRTARDALRLIVLGAGTLPALVALGRRVISARAPGDALLAAGALTCLGGLAVFEQTKALAYGILLWPFFSIIMSLDWATVLPQAATWPVLSPAARLRLVAAICSFCLMVVDGLGTYVWDWWRIPQTSAYASVGAQMEAALTPGARVVGSERWWWALRNHPYWSLNNFLFQMDLPSATPRRPTFSKLVVDYQIDFIIVSNQPRELEGYSPATQTQFWHFIQACAVQMADWTDSTYQHIAIYRVDWPKAQTHACEP